jgi:predicted nucleic acid-binding protein
MTPRHFLDTNLLLYSISRHTAEASKRDRAIELLERDDGALSVQVLQKFYVRATRSTRPDSVPHEIAAGLIATWTRFRVQEITLSILTGALEIKAAHRFLYGDSAIIAAARALGRRELYTEDMTHVREVEGATIINPSADCDRGRSTAGRYCGQSSLIPPASRPCADRQKP